MLTKNKLKLEALAVLQDWILPILMNGQAKVNSLKELQFASREKLSALMPGSVNKAFKGE